MLWSRQLGAGSFLLLVGKGAQMVAGLAFWLVAARTATVEQVGLVAATVSGVMLCTQVALLGGGAAVITGLPAAGAGWRDLLDTTFTVVAGASTVAGVCYVAVTDRLGGTLGTVFGGPGYASVFVLAALCGTMLACLDQVSVAVGRPAQTVSRYATAGALTVAAVAVAGLGWSPLTAAALFACWSAGPAVACALAWRQLRRARAYRYRPAFDARRTGQVLRVGVPYQLLTLTERLPALAVPVLVAEWASPATAAFWYPAWMTTWGVYLVPVMVGTIQFNHTVRNPDRPAATASSAVRTSLLFGAAPALAVAVAAAPLLSLSGPAYADAAAVALRVLVLGLVPYAVIQAYNAACRATGRLREAIGAGLVGAVLTGGATVAAGIVAGVTAMAVAWVVTLTLTALWAAFRLAFAPRPDTAGPVPVGQRSWA